MTTLVEMDEDMQLPSVKWFLEKSGNVSGVGFYLFIDPNVS